MKKISAKEVLTQTRGNDFNAWNRSTSTSLRSEHENDASRRIHDHYAILKPTYSGPILTQDAAIFAMGSCFAREIEAALIRSGGNVVSMDKSIKRDEFKDGQGKIRNTFFHRFTPRSIWQEFMWCFDQFEHWQTETLILGEGENDRIDLNYCQVPGADITLKATLTRREIARTLVRNATKAKIIILTLGLIEAWFHKPTGLYANKVQPRTLRHGDDFELHLLDLADTVQCLEEIYELLHKYHETGDFRFVITVSPVPLQSTFTSDDIIIANATSKAVLRAAETEFVDRYDNVDYFPSYEMVNYSNQDLAWRPDRIHVNPEMVAHIVRTFQETYYGHVFNI